jgi:putative membrane protein
LKKSTKKGKMIEILSMTLLGILCGTFTGIIPGVHTNLLATTTAALYTAGRFGSLDQLSIGVMVFSMAITHTFLSFIPTTFLGVPEGDTALSMLPSHYYVTQGKAHEAILLTLIGSLTSCMATIISLPLFMLLITTSYSFIKTHIPMLLILIAFTLIMQEKKKLKACYIFLAAGVLGIFSLNMNALTNPLLPLLSGLFGVPALMLAMIKETKLPKQQISFPKIKIKSFIKSITTALTTGSIFSFLPSVGPAQAAVFSSLLTKEKSREAYLIIVGSLNTINIIISIITLYLIDKARNGTIVVISEIIPEVTITTIMVYISIILIIACPVTFLTIVISRKFCDIVTKIKYKTIAIIVVIGIILMSLFIAGPISLLVLITATAIGTIPAIESISRNHLMGCLMLPTILFYIML